MKLEVESFGATLRGFRADFLDGASAVLGEAAMVAAETLIIGNRFGPGAPGPDTGFLRASFRVGIGSPASGPSDPPRGLRGTSRGGAAVYGPVLDTARLAAPTLGLSLYCTTMASYAVHLEGSGKRRRTGPSSLLGTSVDFVRGVEQAWPRIVQDSSTRARFGRRGRFAAMNAARRR